MGDWTPPARRFSQLGLRLMTAAVLIPAGLFVVWFGGWWLSVACSIFAAIMAWEWASMSAHPRAWLLCVAAAAFCLFLPIGSVWLQVFLGCFGLGVALLSSVRDFRSRLTSASGLFYVTAMAAGLWFLREGPWDGRAAALYFMSFVWASDAAAYFVGRGMGGPRLIPQESPNKTWSGAVGALLFTAICGVAAADVEGASYLIWGLAGLLLSLAAQTGDLLESGLKRRFRVKDSSGLLPGHGGVLDRVDGLGAVAVLGAAILWLFPTLKYALGLAA